MTEKSGVFETKPIATEIELARLFQGFQLDGVRGNPSDTACKVAPAGGMTVKMSPGFAHVGGYWYESSGTGETATVAAASAQQRTDLAVLHADPAADAVTFQVRQGTPGTLKAPDPVRTPGGVWELPLATIRVGANATTIGTADVTDAREFAGAGVAPSFSGNRPDKPAMGQLVYESDTARWVGNTGGTNWRVVAEDTGWVDLQPAWPTVWETSWQVKVRRVNGVVYLAGAMRRVNSVYGKSDADGTLLAVLPRREFMPAFRHSPAVVCDNGTKGGYVVPGRLYVDPSTGEVLLQHVAADIPIGHHVYLSNTWLGA
ncbi:hypothetical protein BTM25_27100 [Actinomadura rubteroloni]|uniref:Uncharacterized protein n=1 Tax=Actinomadura rubteroloni TaxID=1926885 RepID=A0A2P4UGA2_9ACTN|nr:hypothetical protein [Actinomadura rubteroloni]POM24083.1 hypothetical protein BTM25_27100 [Actinomadura rubteroloni]